MKELEVKILDINVDVIRNTLLKNNAVKVKEENQVNNIYDFPDNTLSMKKGYARIRIVEDLLHKANHCYMTTKKLISQEQFKIMEEHEVEISDSLEGENIFKSLGLRLNNSTKKYRESYKYKSTLIEIDINEKEFCPFPYLEIETSNTEELKEVVSLLGYTMNDTTSKTMNEILREKGVV